MASTCIQVDEAGRNNMSIPLATGDITELDLEAEKDEVSASGSGSASLIARGLEDPKEEVSRQDACPIPTTPGEKPLLCRDILSRDQLSTSLDSLATDYFGTSSSEHGFTSDSDFWTDDEDDDTTNESVLCLTSRGARPLDSSNILRPPLPRRLSFKPLESPASQRRPPILVDELPAMLSSLSSSSSPSPPSSPGSSSSSAAAAAVIFRNDHFSVAQSTIAGWGAFAERDLKYGDRILVERPLLEADADSLFKEFKTLGPREREVALSLHVNENCKPGTPRLLAVWTTNCFSIGPGGRAGLFPIASRFNHSCHPRNNICYTFNPVTGTLDMFVKAETIPAGHELTITYGIKRTPLDLFCRYGFRCRCGACPGLVEDDMIDMW
ncbi:hypothetical protein ACJ41O_013805 [Fusarium nematophilum]